MTDYRYPWRETTVHADRWSWFVAYLHWRAQRPLLGDGTHARTRWLLARPIHHPYLAGRAASVRNRREERD